MCMLQTVMVQTSPHASRAENALNYKFSMSPILQRRCLPPISKCQVSSVREAKESGTRFSTPSPQTKQARSGSPFVFPDLNFRDRSSPPGLVRKCGKRFLLSKPLCESASRRSCRRPPIVLADLHNDGTFHRPLLCFSFFTKDPKSRKNSAPGSFINDDRDRGRFPAWPVFSYSFVSGESDNCIRVRQLRGPHLRT